MNDDLRIALDGGTTNTRARLVRNGVIEVTIKAAAGVRDTFGTGDNPVKAAVRDCLSRLRIHIGPESPWPVVVASGMLGSEAGLSEVPHVSAPATAADIATGSVVWTDPALPEVPIRILPGVRTDPASPCGDRMSRLLKHDIMRGEETQVWGIRRAYERSEPEVVAKPWLLVWPGSHTKLIAVESDGTIAGSFTTMAGETYAALKSATLLRRSVAEATAEADEATLHEASKAVAETGLLRAAFWTRVADVTKSLSVEERSAWLSAVVTAEDVRTLVLHEWFSTARFRRLLVGGEAARRHAYSSLIRHAIGPKMDVAEISTEVVDDAAALGAIELGRLAEELG